MFLINKINLTKKTQQAVFLLFNAIALVLCFNYILKFEFWKENIFKVFLKKC